MNLTISGHHLELTPAIREYVQNKLERIKRHFDHVIDIAVILTIDNLPEKEKRQKAEINLRVRGKDLHAESIAQDLYAAIDTLIDKQLEALGGDALALRGHTAVATAKLAYQMYLAACAEPAFAALAKKGARPQNLLWASTGTKNAAYNDVLYVESLIGAQTINTVPDATLAAFRDHGKAEPMLERDLERAREQYAALRALGIDLDAAGEQLQVEGLQLFADSFRQLLALTADR